MIPPWPIPAVPRWARVLNRRYHFSPAGAAYVVTTMVMILGAINGQNNLLFWLFGLGVGGLLVSGVLSGSPLMGLRIRREVPDVGAVGQPLRVRYVIQSRNWLVPAFALTIEELSAARAWLGKTVDGAWAGRLPQVVTDASYVRPRGEAIAEVVVQPVRRGEVTFCPVRASTAFPFGIIRKSVTFAMEQKVLIRPQPAEVPQELLRTRAGAGVAVGSLTPSRAGMEFFSLREYQPGDALRSVAWRASARMDRPVVRTFATPPGQRLWVMLDCRGAGEDDVERVVAIVAGIATRAVAMGLEVGLVGPDGRVLEPLRSGRRQIDLVLDRLAVFQPGEGSPGDAPAWQLSRVLVVHAGATPSAGVPAHSVAIHAHDPRVRVSLPSPAAQPAAVSRGWWGAIVVMLGETSGRPASTVGGGA